MKCCRLVNSAHNRLDSIAIASLVTICILGTVAVQAGEPLLHLRADTLVEVDASGVVVWSSLSNTASPKRFEVGNVDQRPFLNTAGLNNQPAIQFSAGKFMRGPDAFPVNEDYTLYIAMRWSGTNGSNNLFSGTTRACYLGSSPYPKILHAGNFQQQAASTVGVDGPSIIRIEFKAATGVASIWVNNELGARAGVPANTDPSMLICAYNDGNFFTGDIAEIVLFSGDFTAEQRAVWDSALHRRYNIRRAPDPEPLPLTIIDATQELELIPTFGYIQFSCMRISDSVDQLRLFVDSAGQNLTTTLVDRPQEGWTGDTVSVEYSASVGLHEYQMRVEADIDGVLDTIINSTQIVCGEVIAIEGQSNSIFNDASLPASAFARTFGSNFGKSYIDTTFKRSIASGNGGGANVGGWGLYLQNAFADEFLTPTCVINGGVGGTRIEQHLPDSVNRMNLNTIYGSWLYRLEKSGLKNHIRWLFWYQGESNSGADDYIAKFAQLRQAWQDDLPSLDYIVVVQIRPGCGGAEHALLRDHQRKLETQFHDVIVHTACGLPGHDGCHFTSEGYRELGRQLFNLVRDTREAPSNESAYLAPRVQGAGIDPSLRTVTVSFDRATMIVEVQNASHSLNEAFYFNGNEGMQPDSAWIKGTTVVLKLPEEIGEAVTDVSYVPSKGYLGTTETYAGPWLVDEVGVGALSFFRVPVITTSIEVFPAMESQSPLIVRKGNHISLGFLAQRAELISINGEVTTIANDIAGFSSVITPKTIGFGMFLLKTVGFNRETVRKVLIIP